MFTSHMHPTCGAPITFNITPSSSIFKHIILSVTLHNSTTLSKCCFFNMIPTTFFVCTSTVSHFIFSTYTSCSLPLPAGFLHTHSMSTSLRSIRTSLPLPVMVPTFNVATLSLIFLAFFLSSFLSFLLHCFPPLLCIQVACPPVTLSTQ